MHFAHPQVGVRTLRCEKLAVNGADGQPLVVQHAEPRSAGAEKLTMLTSPTRSTTALPALPEGTPWAIARPTNSATGSSASP